MTRKRDIGQFKCLAVALITVLSFLDATALSPNSSDTPLRLIDYFPIDSQHSYRFSVVFSDLRTEVVGETFSDTSRKGVIKADVVGELVGEVRYYMFKPEGVYIADSMEEIAELPEKLFLPARARIGESWTLREKGRDVSIKLEAKRSELLHVPGDFVVLLLSRSPLEQVKIILERGKGPVMYIKRTKHSSDDGYTIGIGLAGSAMKWLENR